MSYHLVISASPKLGVEVNMANLLLQLVSRSRNSSADAEDVNEDKSRWLLNIWTDFEEFLDCLAEVRSVREFRDFGCD